MKKQFKLRFGLFVCAMFSLFLFSCATKPKETEKEVAWKYMQLNPGEFATWCKERFPNVITSVIPGEIKYVPDSIFVKGDSIPCPAPTKDNPNPSVKVPDQYIPTTKQECTPGTITEADGRDLAIRDEEIRKLKESVAQTEKKLDKKEQELEDAKSKLDISKDKVTKLEKSKLYGWILFLILAAYNIVRIIIKLKK